MYFFRIFNEFLFLGIKMFLFFQFLNFHEKKLKVLSVIKVKKIATMPIIFVMIEKIKNLCKKIKKNKNFYQLVRKLFHFAQIQFKFKCLSLDL